MPLVVLAGARYCEMEMGLEMQREELEGAEHAQSQVLSGDCLGPSQK